MPLVKATASLLIAPALKNGQNPTLMACWCIHQQRFFSHTLMYKAVVVAFSDRSLHSFPQTDYLMKDSPEELILMS